MLGPELFSLHSFDWGETGCDGANWSLDLRKMQLRKIAKKPGKTRLFSFTGVGPFGFMRQMSNFYRNERRPTLTLYPVFFKHIAYGLDQSLEQCCGPNDESNYQSYANMGTNI